MITNILIAATAIFGGLFLLVLALFAHAIEVNEKVFGGER